MEEATVLTRTVALDSSYLAGMRQHVQDDIRRELRAAGVDGLIKWRFYRIKEEPHASPRKIYLRAQGVVIPTEANHPSHLIKNRGGEGFGFKGCILCNSCECHGKRQLVRPCPFYYANKA